MKTLFRSFVSLLAVLLLLPSIASAALVCGSTEMMLVALAERYQEQSAARGLLGDGTMMIVTASDDGSTWTLMQISPDGQTCLLAAGTDWDVMPPPPAGQEG